MTNGPGAVDEWMDWALADGDTAPHRTMIEPMSAATPERNREVRKSRGASDVTDGTVVEGHARVARRPLVAMRTERASSNEPQPAQSPAATTRRRWLHPLPTLTYVVIGALFLAVSLGIGFTLYAVTTVPYSASCVFRVSLPLSQQTGSDFFAANQYMALSEIGYAALDGVYSDALAAPGVDGTSIREAVVVPPSPTNDFALISAKATRPDTAAASVNALCTSYVKHTTAQRAALRDTEIADLRQRITNFNQQLASLSPSATPTVADRVQAESLEAAVAQGSRALAAALSRQPDSIDVVALSAAGFKVDDRNLTANLFYAAAAALVLTFLVILVCEVVGGERLSRALHPPTKGL